MKKEITKWEPRKELDLFKDLRMFEKDMERVFSFPTMFDWRGMTGVSKEMERWNPSVDVIDHPKEVIVKAEIPGMKKEDIVIEVTGDCLTIKGEKREEKEHKDKKYHARETFYGSFERELTLPGYVDESKIDATYKDGVLQIKLPKKEGRKERHVTVHVK